MQKSHRAFSFVLGKAFALSGETVDFLNDQAADWVAFEGRIGNQPFFVQRFGI